MRNAALKQRWYEGMAGLCLLASLVASPAAFGLPCEAGEVAAQPSEGAAGGDGSLYMAPSADFVGTSPALRGRIGADGVIPGTRWRLEAPDRWTAAELRAFAALAARLPADYRLPPRRVTFRKRQAPDLPAASDPGTTSDLPAASDLPAPPDRAQATRPSREADRTPAIIGGLDHPLANDLLRRFTTRGDRHLLGRAHPLRSRVTLYIDGLEAQLAPSLARTAALLDRPVPADAASTLYTSLLERQIVHELTHLIDAKRGWSRSEAWRRIGGWSLFARALRTPPDRDPASYASAYGMTGPAEDLATLAEVYFVPPRVGPTDADRHPRCRLADRWAFLHDRLEPHPDPAPNVRCARLDQVDLDPARVDHLEVLYIAPTFSSVASVAGHLLLGVVYLPDREGIVVRDAYGQVADPAGAREGSMRYIVAGLTGGFISRIQREPYQVTLTRYSELEDRDIRRYRLTLSETEKREVLERLDAMRFGGQRPYFFLHRNCTRLVVDLLEPVLDERLPAPMVLSPDLVMADLYRRGRLEPLPATQLQELAVSTRAQVAAPLRAQAGARLESRLGRDAATRADSLSALASPDPSTRDKALEQVHDLLNSPPFAGSEAAPGQGSEAAPGPGEGSAPRPGERAAAAGSLAPPSGAIDSDLALELERYLLLTDPIVHARALRAARQGQRVDAKPLDALRSVRQRLRTASGARYQPGVAFSDVQRQVLEAAREDRTRFSSHTSYRRLSVGPALGGTSSDAWPGATTLIVRTALLSTELGEPRQFNLTEGAALTLLASEVALGMTPADRVRARVSGFRGAYLPRQPDRRFPLGVHLHVAELEFDRRAAVAGTGSAAMRSPTSLRADSRWMRAGPVLNLWQIDDLRHYLNVSAGLELSSRLDFTTGPLELGDHAELLALATPVRMDLKLGSSRQALTVLRAGLELSPRLTTSATFRRRLEADVLGRLHLGRISGLDAALGLRYSDAFEASFDGRETMRDWRVGLEFWFERF